MKRIAFYEVATTTGDHRRRKAFIVDYTKSLDFIWLACFSTYCCVWLFRLTSKMRFFDVTQNRNLLSFAERGKRIVMMTTGLAG